MTSLELAAALPAMALAPGHLLALRARLQRAAMRGGLRWAAHPGDRRWIAGRFALPLQDTPFATQVGRVGLRHYALTQRCTVLEERAEARRAVALVSAATLPDRAIVAFVHSPAMWLCLYGMANAGVRFMPAVADWFWADPMRAVREEALASAGGEAIGAGGGFDALHDAIVDGAVPGLAVDVAGSTPARFLGKDARLRSGIARLAQATGASILPLHGEFRCGRPVAVLGAPIPPRDDTQALLAQVVAAVEAPLLRRPERWMPYTCELWPDRCAPFRAAYDEDQPVPEVGSVA